ncbi:MAG: NUDIX hydrolase, partial [Clostridia bacterium]|nr:NUDIX hydrolase [Clostridia bacterium]
MNDLTEKTLSQSTAFQGRLLRLRVDEALLPDGTTAGREVVEHPGGVGVLALTEDRKVLLVRQYRYPYGEILTEIPAGKRDPGEDPLTTGMRELEEETGYRANTFTPLGVVYPS